LELTIENPIYGYLATELTEIGCLSVVVAVDNLLRLQKTLVKALELFLEHVIPAFFNGDKEGVLARAK
jgi:hypothetical protein